MNHDVAEVNGSDPPMLPASFLYEKEPGYEATHFAHAFFLLNQMWYAFRFANVRNSSAWARNYKIRRLARSFDQWPLPTSVYLGRHWCHSRDKWYQAFPLRFCILQAIKNWTVGRPGNELLRMHFQLVLTALNCQFANKKEGRFIMWKTTGQFFIATRCELHFCLCMQYQCTYLKHVHTILSIYIYTVGMVFQVYYYLLRICLNM